MRVTSSPLGEYLILKIRLSKLVEGSNETGSGLLKFVRREPVSRSHTCQIGFGEEVHLTGEKDGARETLIRLSKSPATSLL